MQEWLAIEDISKTIEFWGIVISAVIALATIFQVLMTYAISRSIAKATTTSEVLTQAHNIDAQWQELNLRVISNSEVRNTVRRYEALTEAEEVTQLRYLIFYKLNVLNMAWLAARTKRDGYRKARATIQSQVALMREHKDFVLTILRSNRGFEKQFLKDIEQILLK